MWDVGVKFGLRCLIGSRMCGYGFSIWVEDKMDLEIISLNGNWICGGG